MSAIGPGSGTIAGVLPSAPRDNDSWDDDVSREIARSAPGRSSSGFYAGAPEPVSRIGARGGDPEDEEEEIEEEIPVVPVRRRLSVAIAGFSALLGLGLVLGAQTSGPDARLPYAIVVFGVQLLYILAFTMAIRSRTRRRSRRRSRSSRSAASSRWPSPGSPGCSDWA